MSNGLPSVRLCAMLLTTNKAASERAFSYSYSSRSSLRGFASTFFAVSSIASELNPQHALMIFLASFTVQYAPS